MLAKADMIISCYVGPQISPENFVKDHFFLYLIEGVMNGYDGNRSYVLHAGECCIVRKNHLARYNKQKVDDRFEKVVISFDEPFLKQFRERYPVQYDSAVKSNDAFLRINQSDLIPGFLSSLKFYFKEDRRIDKRFEDVKREELLLILLMVNPELANIFFDFGVPEKLNLEAFMNRNFRFNVDISRFAYLTGRSLTSFKEDFKRTFNETPGRWLVQKRLHEAHFLIEKHHRKPSDVYLEVGFEDLSHFSFAFKKLFGVSPSQLAEQPK